MADDSKKSAAIIALDSTPASKATAGEGGGSKLVSLDAFVAISAAASTASLYRMLRVASTVKVKTLILEATALTAGKFNASVYYSDSTVDGTAAANQGLIVPTTGDQFFASDVDLSSAVGPTDITNESGNYVLTARQKPFWSALGLTSDPGGFFDICLVCHTTAVTSAGSALLRVSFAE